MMATADRPRPSAEEAVLETYSIPEELWDALGFLAPESAKERHKQDQGAALAYMVAVRDGMIERGK